MPAVGDQHNNAPTNPFEDLKPHISEYTAVEIATLQSRLQKQLGPEYISTRKGPGGKNVHYIASEKVIGLANEVFGFNGWSSTIRDIQVDFVDENVQTHKVDIGLSVIVRVTLRDGTYHEDIGYGHIENCSGKAAAFEKAKKEGTTDALKRSLRNFGNVLGNCVYDKDYLGKVTKLKVKPSKFSEDNLFRHPDYSATKTEPQAEPVKPVQNPTILAIQATEMNGVQSPSRRNSVHTEGEDEFGSADFDEADFSFAGLDHPDEMAIDPPNPTAAVSRSAPQQKLQQGQSRPPSQGANPRPPSLAPQNQAVPRQQSNGVPHAQTNGRPQVVHGQPQTRPNGVPAQVVPNAQVNTARPAPAHPQGTRQVNLQAQVQRSGPPQQHNQQQQVRQQAQPQQQLINQVFEQPIPAGAPTGFVSAKAAEPVQAGANVAAQLPQFNPRAESPSIRKTAGVDHTKSMGITRAHIFGQDTTAPVRAGQPDMGRRIGAPQTVPSPLANRGSFKPPGTTSKRPADGMNPPQQQQNRTVLNDVTTTSVNAPAAPAPGPDAKRPRLEGEANTTAGVNAT